MWDTYQSSSNCGRQLNYSGKMLSNEQLASHVLFPPLCKASYGVGSSAGSEHDLNERRSSSALNEGLISVMITNRADGLY